MPAKIKARDLFKGWPRGRSTSAFTGRRCDEFLSGNRYRVMYVPWERQQVGEDIPYDDWRQEFLVTPDFRRTVEERLESEYRAGQQAMAGNHRATYRTLTEADRHWLWRSDADPLRDAMKKSFRQYADGPVPTSVLLAIKEGSANDPYWYQFQRAMTCTGTV